MAVSNIPNKSIPAPVIAVKNFIFIEDGQLNPQERIIPCEQEFIDYVPYWAVPIKDGGIFTNLQFTPAKDDFGNSIDAPSYDSFLVTRVRDKISQYTWWVPATIDQITAACATCCDEEFTPIPTPDLPIIAPCQLLCDAINGDGDYYSVWAAPELGGGEHYEAWGSYNNQPFVPLTASNLANLVAAMNSNWGSVGSTSPGIDIDWTNPSGNTIIATGGELNSSLCVVILATT